MVLIVLRVLVVGVIVVVVVVAVVVVVEVAAAVVATAVVVVVDETLINVSLLVKRGTLMTRLHVTGILRTVFILC